MSVLWEKTGEAFHATVADPEGAVQYLLVVEPDAGGWGWGWTLWRPGKAPAIAKRGHAATRHGAFFDAEHAAE